MNNIPKGLDDLDKTKKHILPCGHNNARFFNVWPFDLGYCVDCECRFTIAQIKVVQK